LGAQVLKPALRRERHHHGRISSNNPLHLFCGIAVTIKAAAINWCFFNR
jgi:hypothetical protein